MSPKAQDFRRARKTQARLLALWELVEKGPTTFNLASVDLILRYIHVQYYYSTEKLEGHYIYKIAEISSYLAHPNSSSSCS